MVTLEEDLAVDSPWVLNHRLPVIHSAYPRFSYFVAVSIPPVAEENLFQVATPTDKEFEILASYNRFRIANSGLSQSYLGRIATQVIDIDSGHASTIFEKKETGNWTYRKSTFEHPVWPFWNAKRQFPDLVELIDHVEHPFGSRWNEWKEERSITTAL